jgi:rhodanese-related sulfurtransferase
MQELTPAEVVALQARQALLLLDVRQPEELALAAVTGARHIPMNEIPARLGELEPDAPLAVLCHHGSRSLMVARFLERNGFTQVFNVSGGIDAWSRTADPAIPLY